MTCTNALSRCPDYNKGTEDNDSMTLLKPEHIHRSSTKYHTSTLVDKIRLHADSNAATFSKHSSIPGWTFKDGLACWYNRIIVPDLLLLRECILKECHDSVFTGHPGCTKTLELDFWWPSVCKDCHKYIDRCSTCQYTKPLRQKPFGLLSPNEILRTFGKSYPATSLPTSPLLKVSTH